MGEPVLGERAQRVANWGYRYRVRLTFGLVVALQLLTLWAALSAMQRADSAATWASDAYSAAYDAGSEAEEAARIADDVFDEVRALRDYR